MASNRFGQIFTLTTFGESHGPSLGVVLDGVPAGLPLVEADFLPELMRRRPGQSSVTTARNEADTPEIQSGVFEGRTTGAPIAILVRNVDQRPKDYEPLKDVLRPGHADAAYQSKYGLRDHRGGGRSSGRETVARVLAGVVARKILPQDVRIVGHAVQIGPHKALRHQPETIEQNPVRCADPDVALAIVQYLLELKEQGNSVGGMLQVYVSGMPKDLGDPVFMKLKSQLAASILSIGAVTGFAYGAGFSAASMLGSDYIADPVHAGGMLGGISTGEDLLLSVSVKPSSSVHDVARKGRHDPCVVPRVIPVVEAMVAIVLADAWLMQRALNG